jgi:hypothetical protein
VLPGRSIRSFGPNRPPVPEKKPSVAVADKALCLIFELHRLSVEKVDQLPPRALVSAPSSCRSELNRVSTLLDALRPDVSAR